MLEGLTYVEAVLWIGERLAEGLAHAHERGILHRDLKPANVLLTDDGQPMLLDFNLSADVKTDVSRARVGGTLPYMAPEHLACFANKPAPFPTGTNARAMPDARSDVYALGVILYELLTGEAPFKQATGNPREMLAEMIRLRLAGPPRVRTRNRSVSPAVESILQHCLEPDPDWRYQSARQLAEDLERQRTDQPLAHAREQSCRERATKWLRRNRRGAILTTGAFVLLLLCLAGGLALRNGDRLAHAEALATLSAFHEEREEAHLLLAGRPDDDEQRREGLRIAHQALARYNVIGRSDWREQPTVRRLPPEERERLAQDMGELLLLIAGTGADNAQELTELADDCFPADQAPRALYVHRAELAERRGARAEARDWRDVAERRPIRNAMDHYLLARTQIGAGNFARATRHLREAATLDVKHFSAWYLLGHLCLDGAAEAGTSEAEAIRCYTACIALRPKFYGSYHNRGLAYLRQRRLAEAEADFTQAQKLRPELPDVYVYRGLAREGLGKLNDALADLSHAIDLGNAASRAFFARARVRRKLGDKDGADRDETAGLKRPPRDAESYICRGCVLWPTAPAEALADFRAAVRLSPHSLPGLFNQALILADRMGQTQEAVLVLDQVVRRYPSRPSAWSSRGILLARLGEREAAHEDGRVALKLAGNSSEALFHAACIHALTSRSHLGDRHMALRFLAQALRSGLKHERARECPDLAPLRQDPRFHRLVEAVKALDEGAR
jgi:Flp pilus assembly protein TadD